MEKINIAELLKDCPKGMELDCTLFSNVAFNCVANEGIWIKSFDSKGHENEIYLDCEGCLPLPSLNSVTDKCVIFPKGKTTWEGFVPPCKFKDGDILSYQCVFLKNRTIYIYRHDEVNNTSYYVALSGDIHSTFLINDEKEWTLNGYNDTARLASEEEKQKLFDAIKANGYKWNSETKTLEKFVEPKFKDGDIITCTNSVCSFISVFKEMASAFSFKHHCSLIVGTNTFIHDIKPVDYTNPRFATEEEKQKLFNAAKENGYIWYPVTKTLERLFEPKFKVGDKIKPIGSDRYYTIKNIEFDRYILNNNQFIRFNDEHDFELTSDKLIEPKFKVGDRIKCIHNNNQYHIIGITDTHYTLEEVENKFKYTEPIIGDKNWELVPKKFDIATLKPFESKVLVRDDGYSIWQPSIWGLYDKGHRFPYITTGCRYRQCIPCEGNEHLLGKTDNCDDYYKTW